MDVVINDKNKKEETLKLGDIVYFDYGHKTFSSLVHQTFDGKLNFTGLDGNTFSTSPKETLEDLLDYLQNNTGAKSYQILSQDEFMIEIKLKSEGN